MSDPGQAIARRDEVLELLYWIEGEGFAGAASLAGLARFLVQPEPETAATLEALVERGDVVQDAGSSQYRLTEVGRREAAKRFRDEFAPMLAQGHGECNDPDCECRISGDPALCRSQPNGG